MHILSLIIYADDSAKIYIINIKIFLKHKTH